MGKEKAPSNSSDPSSVRKRKKEEEAKAEKEKKKEAKAKDDTPPTFLQRHIIKFQLGLALAAAAVSVVPHLHVLMRGRNDPFRLIDAYTDPKKWYETHAHNYSGIFGAWNYSLPKSTVALLHKHHSQAEVDVAKLHLLEVGAGGGFVGAELKHLGYAPVTGVDISPEMIAQAQKSGAYAKMMELDGDQIPMASVDDASYDALICVGTSGHLGRQAGRVRADQVHRVLQEWVRVLKAGSLLAFSVEKMFWPAWEKEINMIRDMGLLVEVEAGVEVDFLPGHPEEWLNSEKSMLSVYSKAIPQATPKEADAGAS